MARKTKADFFDYDGFLDKFEPKKTTDDCYTPPAVYEAVKDWVVKEYAVDTSAPIIRPFVPGGDFEKCEYPAGCAVIDNPPFSILSHIVEFYTERAIPFFLFAPALNCLNKRTYKVTIIAVNAKIVYENGAKVLTSFVTNMAPKDVVIDTPPDLYAAIDRANRQKEKRELQKFIFPRNAITTSRLSNIARNGRRLTIMRKECLFASDLEALKKNGKSVFGNALIISSAAAERAAAERAAAERAAAERAAERAAAAAAERAAAERAAEKLELSAAEMAAVEWLDKQEDKE